jgi:cholest-4-en-3-one 26-monooxygenase
VQLSDVNLDDLNVFERGVPHDWFRMLRRDAPVYWHQRGDDPGYWAITCHADLKAISRNPGLFSSERKGTLLREVDDAGLTMMRQIMLNMDPPRHRSYRALINKAFTPRMIDNLRPRIVALVEEIVDEVIEKGECDFVEELAAPLPMLVICEMMGVPQEDRRRVYEVGNSMVGFDDPELQDDGKPRQMQGGGEQGMAGMAELFMYAAKLREKALANPGDDLATGLVNVELDGNRLSPEEFSFFFMLLLIAGNETTRTVTTNGMISLLENPGELQALQSDLSLIDSAVEEILRFSPAVHSFRRTATRDTAIRGIPVREDDKIILWYPSANRDESVFSEPDRFHIRRTPNDHVAFGYGEHYCLGANLARMELQEIFRGIADRIHGLEMTAEPRRLRSNFINGVKEMRVRFRPGPKRARVAA